MILTGIFPMMLGFCLVRSGCAEGHRMGSNVTVIRSFLPRAPARQDLQLSPRNGHHQLNHSATFPSPLRTHTTTSQRSMSSPSDTDELALDSSLFEEPPSYARPPTPPCTFSTHTLLSGPTFNLRLVGHDPLWGHHLWNSGRVIANYLETHAEELVRGKDVLELGAGAGLPGLVCGSVGGARRVRYISC